MDSGEWIPHEGDRNGETKEMKEKRETEKTRNALRSSPVSTVVVGLLEPPFPPAGSSSAVRCSIRDGRVERNGQVRSINKQRDLALAVFSVYVPVFYLSSLLACLLMVELSTAEVRDGDWQQRLLDFPFASFFPGGWISDYLGRLGEFGVVDKLSCGLGGAWLGKSVMGTFGWWFWRFDVETGLCGFYVQSKVWR